MKNIYLLFLIMFAIGTDTFIVSPLLPTLENALHIKPEHLGWIVGAYAMGYALFAIFIGPLSDGWNRKKVLLIGLICFATATLFCGWAFNEWSILLFRLLAGMSAAMVAPQVWALVPALVDPKDIIKGIGIAAAGLSFSQFIGVPLGSFLAMEHWSTPFYILGAFSYVLAIFSVYLLPELTPSQNQTVHPWTRYKQLFSSTQSIPGFLAYLLFQIGNFGSFTMIGLVLHDFYHLSLFGIGTTMILLGAGNLLGSFSGAALTKKFSTRTVFYSGIFSLVLLYLVLSTLPLISIFAACFLVVFTLGGILFPIMMSSLQSLQPSLRGTISSLASAVMYAGASIGSTSTGWFYHALHGFHAVGLFTVIFFLLSVIFFGKSKFFKKKICPAFSSSYKAEL
ncbi:MFS transporter [Bacillus sp. BRMEA1]|uniref:MFS transporter n=1 Tax=Neobacillus endophyticus TaxID=2738405 RepID=UPI001566006F|nr:MFS transporter [Neobacillus endophyticus]NRD76829.1 MFS transporter [Neobacillus endophyticus]